MKLAIVRKKFNPFGGAEKFIQRLIAILSTKRQIDIYIIANSWSGTEPKDVGKIEVKTLGVNRFVDYLSFLRQVDRSLKQNHFDIVQSHERIVGADIFRLGDGVHAAWLKRYSKALPWYRRALIRLDPFHQLLIRQEKKIALDLRTHYVANSELVKNELQNIYSVSDDRITVIPNGIDIDFFRPPSPDERKRSRDTFCVKPGCRVVGFVGSGFYRKGLYELIDAIETLPNIQLLVAGHDKHLAKIHVNLFRRKLTDRVKLLGPVTHSREIYWAADFVALPTLYDPSSNAIIEALSCGIPVLTTEGSGNASDIRNYHAGLVCGRDPCSIRKGLLQLLSMNTQLLSKNARLLALNHSDAVVLNSWASLYERIIRNSTEPDYKH